MSKLSNFTKNKSLFCKTVWGQLELDNKENNTEKYGGIFSNRNRFVEEFKIIRETNNFQYIKKYIDYMENKFESKLPNIEAYETESKDILFVYSGDNEFDGWTKISNIYSNEIPSFVFIISKADMRKATVKPSAYYVKKFYERNGGNPTVVCATCGGSYKYSARYDHCKTKKHKIMVELKEKGLINL